MSSGRSDAPEPTTATASAPLPTPDQQEVLVDYVVGQHGDALGQLGGGDHLPAAADRVGSPFWTARESGKPLTRRYIEEITKAWGTAANVPDCLPHRFRHTTATELLRGGEDIRVIQKVLDHADLKSTVIYTKVHDEQIRSALLRLPETWGKG